MILAEAEALAQGAIDSLSPYCHRIQIAGSVRRRKAKPRDIEIICIPRGRDLAEFGNAVNRWERVKGQAGGKYTQRRLPDGTKLDLFMTTPEQWGAILLIRTGPAEFSKRVTGSLLPRQGYKCDGGYIWKDSAKVETPEESDVFFLAGLLWIEPELRA